MLCHICSRVELKDLIPDPKDGGKIRHCHECEAAIQENLAMISGERQDDGEDPIIIQDFDNSDLEILGDILLEEAEEEEVAVDDTSFQQGYYSPSRG